MTLADLPLFAPRPAIGLSPELARVTSRLAEPILAWLENRCATQRPRFHLDELSAALHADGYRFAPDSPARILRMLRRRGLVRVELISRAESLYQVGEVE